ncbi:MAG: glycogen synthase [Deltaproteobacteria bacterium]|nr:glycogen synthase [Deltaproteobacteria bacterium]
MALSVIYVSPEAVPFSKTGGLADVAGALPSALKGLGAAISVFLPLHRQTASGGFNLADTGVTVSVPIGVKEVRGRVLKSVETGVDTYFLKCDEYFDRTHLYTTHDGDYSDNLERFAFFSRGVLEAVKVLKIRPDIIHANDWQTGLIPAYLKDVYKQDSFFSKAGTVFTIHNLAYQGLFPAALYDLTGLGKGLNPLRGLFTPEGLEFWGKVSCLKAGIVYSDVITTVSRTYALEMQTTDYGCGLEGVLKERKDDLHGIVNGVDYDEWDPAEDTLIPANYSPDDLTGKAVCKKELLKKFGLTVKASTPVIGMVSRFTHQKGFDLVAEAAPDIMKLGAAVVILGTGEKKYQLVAEGLAAAYPGRFAVNAAFDNALAHLIEAGSDIFLMPSLYEPCGLNQIYSLKYGTVPVVRATGGLEDTVKAYPLPGATGFKFKEYEAPALVKKVKEAETA